MRRGSGHFFTREVRGARERRSPVPPPFKTTERVPFNPTKPRFRRETLRWFGVYEVLRAVYCIEPEEAIR